MITYPEDHSYVIAAIFSSAKVEEDAKTNPGLTPNGTISEGAHPYAKAFSADLDELARVDEEFRHIWTGNIRDLFTNPNTQKT